MIEVPYTQLSEASFQSILEEFASRDGTEFTSLTTKVAQLHQQVESGLLKIWFEPIEGTCQLVRADAGAPPEAPEAQ